MAGGFLPACQFLYSKINRLDDAETVRLGRDIVGKDIIGNEKYYQDIPRCKGA